MFFVSQYCDGQMVQKDYKLIKQWLTCSFDNIIYSIKNLSSRSFKGYIIYYCIIKLCCWNILSSSLFFCMAAFCSKQKVSYNFLHVWWFGNILYTFRKLSSRDLWECMLYLCIFKFHMQKQGSSIIFFCIAAFCSKQKVMYHFLLVWWFGNISYTVRKLSSRDFRGCMLYLCIFKFHLWKQGSSIIFFCITASASPATWMARAHQLAHAFGLILAACMVHILPVYGIGGVHNMQFHNQYQDYVQMTWPSNEAQSFLYNKRHMVAAYAQVPIRNKVWVCHCIWHWKQSKNHLIQVRSDECTWKVFAHCIIW